MVLIFLPVCPRSWLANSRFFSLSFLAMTRANLAQKKSAHAPFARFLSGILTIIQPFVPKLAKERTQENQRKIEAAALRCAHAKIAAQENEQTRLAALEGIKR